MTHPQILAHHLHYKVPSMKLCLVHENKPRRKPLVIQSPEDAAKLLAPLKMAPEEHFISLHLNVKHEVIGLHEVSHGSLAASLVHPREVFKAAIIANSYAILVCHNHPSGSAIKPSSEDIDTTKQLLQAGKLLGVALVDHVIVGPNRRAPAYSFREHHPDLWADA